MRIRKLGRRSLTTNGREWTRIQILNTGWRGWACRELIKAAVVGEPGPGEPSRLISRPRLGGISSAQTSQGNVCRDFRVFEASQEEGLGRLAGRCVGMGC